ncbi:hypothetical protein A1Q2_04198 [Trichosporon asahii var. asahii CBS 8904]|uniref:26S proteasome complex subunit SEM1 n=2 Tax=Trichosporon asahii var. asahii TaxID=189963 RepID=K1VL65_TRIAC|nr:hypothetical protein A1Q1_03400 [Trichosporon asahii var. asahii CBS 2479]EJT47735.1 hypothetical protein A1Q1_03400 [Trichosporon asahii var. asahii CBS 2479]EKD01496.1 hypothetical protein A1Q2_04198 [Trichosporon asahii var. asahii CBS 8904]
MADNNEKKVENETKPQEEKKKLPQLGALEDDDEFEEGTVADGLQSTQEQLWEDNWDDDDVEDDFQKQLRQAIAERAGGDDAMKE